MNRFKLFTVILFLVFAGTLVAQELKFGHINMQELIVDLPDKKVADDKLQAEAQTLQNRMQKMSEELETKYKEYLADRETMPELIRSTMEKEIQDMGQRLQNYEMMAQQTLAKKEQELYQPILEKIQKAVDVVGQKNGLIYIFDVSSQVVLYHSEKSIDCVEMVKTELAK